MSDGKEAASLHYPPWTLSSPVLKCPEWIRSGCGSQEYMFVGQKPNGDAVDASFPGHYCPDKLPDLSEHNNFMAEVLRKDPSIYEKIKDRITPMGVIAAKCVKTGIDNRGHPMIKTVGLVAGDEESYEYFKELFDPVIEARHGGYGPDSKHPTDLDWDHLSETVIDPTRDAEGNCKYILTSRVRTGRSVRGMRLPPSCTFEERREIERVVVKGLLNLQGELAGDYLPLHGNRSFAPKPDGMSEADEQELRSKGNLFQEPDSTLLLSSGCGRHWPDARGIFHNKEKNFFVWINEEDHMRIISMEPGDGIRSIFKRFAVACTEVQRVLKEEGYDFMHNDHLGYILTCPSNLGTGLRAGAMVRLPLVSARPDFKELCGCLRLQARGTAGVDSASTGGIWDISNADRLGMSEVELVNVFIEGVARFIRWEMLLEKAESIDPFVAFVKRSMAAAGA